MQAGTVGAGGGAGAEADGEAGGVGARGHGEHLAHVPRVPTLASRMRHLRLTEALTLLPRQELVAVAVAAAVPEVDAAVLRVVEVVTCRPLGAWTHGARQEAGGRALGWRRTTR